MPHKKIHVEEQKDERPKETVKCPECSGRGIRVDIDERSLCPKCHGSGLVEVEDGR